MSVFSNSVQVLSPPASKGRQIHTPEDRGLYILVVHLKDAREIKAGRLPKTTLSPGCFLYVGRAKRHLWGRLERHTRREKKVFWHIDYLLSFSQILEIWLHRDFFDECHVAEKILSGCPMASIPIRGFGSSDCRCPSHLLQVSKEDCTWRRLMETMNFEKVVNDGYPS